MNIYRSNVAVAGKTQRRSKQEKADINKVWNAVFDHTIADALKNVPDDALTSSPRKGLRNWQKFMLCYSFCMAGGALILYSIDGLLTALVGLAIWLLTALIILATVPKGRL